MMDAIEDNDLTEEGARQLAVMQLKLLGFAYGPMSDLPGSSVTYIWVDWPVTYDRKFKSFTSWHSLYLWLKSGQWKS